MKKLLKLEVLYVLIAACISIWILFGKVFIGVADNGDFLRIMGTAGLNYYDPSESYDDMFFKFSHAQFAYDSFFRGFYPSTQIFLVVIARTVALLFNGSAFDIRFLGAIYAALLIVAGYLLVKHSLLNKLITRAIFTLLLLIVFSDIGYLAYFNSLYGEPVSFVFLLLTFALGLLLVKQQNPSKTMLVLFFVSILFLVGSKTQNAPIGIGFALLGLRYAWLKSRDYSWRKLAISLSAFMCLISIVMYIAAPKDFRNINIYQTVFFGILNGSPDVEGDLEDLGLPSHLSVLAGTNYFQSDTVIKQNDPSLNEDFYERISHGDVLLFYLSHPSRLISKMEYAAENSFNIRPYYLGNYEKEAGYAPEAMSFDYSLWSELKRTIFPQKLWFIVLFCALYYGVALYEWFKAKSLRSKVAVELFMLLGLIGIFSFLIPIVGDGQADLSKHLFLYNVVFDMMIVSSVMWLIHQIANKLKR